MRLLRSERGMNNAAPQCPKFFLANLTFSFVGKRSFSDALERNFDVGFHMQMEIRLAGKVLLIPSVPRYCVFSSAERKCDG